MFVLGELALYFGADSQRGRIRSQTLRKIPLQLLQLSKELVVVRVRHCRTIENVILVRCAGENDPQFRGAVKLRPLGLLLRL